jgi:tRNA-splicing ligase RtcB
MKETLCDDGGVKVFGQHDAGTVAQLERCAAAEPNVPAVLCADGHLGYSMPIGGVVGYRAHVSPSGIGYDIACGNLAVRTNLQAADVAGDEMRRLAQQIERRITFGVGGKNHDAVADHPVFDRIADSPVEEQRALLGMARSQLGTVGAGNHYVDVLEDMHGPRVPRDPPRPGTVASSSSRFRRGCQRNSGSTRLTPSRSFATFTTG